MHGDQAWEHEAPPFRAIVLRRADLVYVVVGEGEREDMAGAMEELPDARPMGLSHRLRDAMEDLVATFALG